MIQAATALTETWLFRFEYVQRCTAGTVSANEVLA